MIPQLLTYPVSELSGFHLYESAENPLEPSVDEQAPGCVVKDKNLNHKGTKDTKKSVKGSNQEREPMRKQDAGSRC